MRCVLNDFNDLIKQSFIVIAFPRRDNRIFVSNQFKYHKILMFNQLKILFLVIIHRKYPDTY